MKCICALRNIRNILKTTVDILKAAVLPLLSAALCVILLSCGAVEPDAAGTETKAAVTKAETDETDALQTIPEIVTEPATETEEETTEQITTEEKTTAEETTEQITAEETTAPPATETETETEKETAAETADVPDDPLGFKADLSSYEKYLDPEDKDAYLILVNPDHPLGETYKPADLVYIADSREGRKDQLRLYAAKSLEAFIKEARANGCKRITSVSAYRPYNTQKYIFDTDVEKLMQQGYSKEEATAIERKDTAYPGESEHQSGLAVDVLDDDSSLYEFESTYEARWLAENAWKFGFILRYPKDKEEITTYVYEPWHFRYVGRYHAKRIYDMGMCLEEYTEYLANNG